MSADPVRFQFPKLGLKLLALLLGIMSWYLIQDAIRLEGAAVRRTARAPVVTNSVMRLENVPVSVLVRPGAWDWRLEPPAVSVLLEGADDDLNRLDLTTVRAFVDGSAVSREGEYAMHVRVYAPGEARLKSAADPALVRVSFRPVVKGAP